MTDLTVSNFNAKNVHRADQEQYRPQLHAAKGCAWKRDWIADRQAAQGDDVLECQKIVKERAEVVALTQRWGQAPAEFATPDAEKRCHKRVVFHTLARGNCREGEVPYASIAKDTAPRSRRQVRAASRRWLMFPSSGITAATEAIKKDDATGSRRMRGRSWCIHR